MDSLTKHSMEIEAKQKKGMTSFDKIDTKKLLSALNLKPSSFVADLGCGTGDYSLFIAQKLSPSGTVVAVDKWPQVTAALDSKIAASGLKNIKTLAADMTEFLPLPDNSADIVLTAMVLHGLKRLPSIGKFFEEVKRILKTDGRFVVVEFKKEQNSFGPPCELKLSPQELESMLVAEGFIKGKETDLNHAYMIEFSKNI